VNYSSSPNATATFGGHFYELYLTKNMYGSAERFALGRVHQNLSGYLLTITSEKENSFIQDVLLKPNQVDSVWLGAHDSDTEGEWKWNREGDGPEADRVFYIKPRAGTSEEGVVTQNQDSNTASQFSNWRSGEPNDADADEDCAVMVGQDAGWNDVRCGFVEGNLIVEFGSAELNVTIQQFSKDSNGVSNPKKAHEEL